MDAAPGMRQGAIKEFLQTCVRHVGRPKVRCRSRSSGKQRVSGWGHQVGDPFSADALVRGARGDQRVRIGALATHKRQPNKRRCGG